MTGANKVERVVGHTPDWDLRERNVMSNKVITFVIDTLDPKLDHILAAAINEINSAGHTLKQVRVTDDSGEVVVPPNTVEGVNPPEEPAPEEPVDPVVEPPAEDEPASEEEPPPDNPEVPS